MIAIAVDDEPLMLGALAKAISASADITSVTKFSDCEDAIDYIIANCRITLSAAEIADKLCVAPVTLQKQFKKEVGTPLGQYIQKMVLRRAEMDIRNTDTLIKDISENYGFSDQFYFYRLFYKHHHMSPSIYRKRRYIV